MNKPLLYFLLLLVVNSVAIIVFSVLDSPKECYIGSSVLLAIVYGGLLAILSRKKKN